MARQPKISLHPLPFDEAVTDILKIKPEPKPPKQQPKPKAKRRGKSGPVSGT